MKTQVSKTELMDRWSERAEIEEGIADVYNKHDQPDEAAAHLGISRTWRQAIAELRDDLADEKQ